MRPSRISVSTKAALASRKGKGVLGNRTNLEEAQRKGAQAQAISADQFAEAMVTKIRAVLPHVRIVRRTKTLEEIASALTKGGTSNLRGRQKARNLSHIATLLNEDGVKTARGGSWSSVTVKRVILRAHKLGLLDGS